MSVRADTVTVGDATVGDATVGDATVGEGLGAVALTLEITAQPPASRGRLTPRGSRGG